MNFSDVFEFILDLPYYIERGIRLFASLVQLALLCGAVWIIVKIVLEIVRVLP